jgi:hypothetical protein
MACVGVEVEGEEAVDEAQQSVTIDNALISNALISNALISNALISNALISNALISNALISNALISNALEDPDARELLKYVVSCALPSGAHFDLDIQGQTYGFDGTIGLAPEWGQPGGKCNKTCQSWVSGCVLSRLNYLGETVTISIRGKHSSLHATAQEQAAFTHREATYYGNIFKHEKELFACLSPGETQITRVCGPSIDDCVLTVVGDCDEWCGPERSDGSFTKCRGVDPCKWWKKGDKHVGSVTAFLEP